MKTIRVSPTVLAVSLAVCVTGCASVDPGPFNQFASGLQGLRDGVDAQAAVDVQNARDRFAAKVGDGTIIPPELQLELASDAMPPFRMKYGFIGEEPLYFKLARFKQGLGSLNDAMVAYAGLLAKLAGDEVVDPVRFDKLTRDLNANAASAATSLNMQGSGEEIALLSTVAVKIFQAMIDKKRRKELGEAIAAVQPQVDKFSSAVQTAIKFLGTGVTADYGDKIRPLIAPGATDPFEKILALNTQTQQTMDTLGSLYNAYGQLPEAHADLKDAVNKRSGALTGLINFNNEALRLNALYLELAAANQAAGQ